MSRPNVFELKEKFKRPLPPSPLSASNSKRARHDTNVPQGSPSTTPTATCFPNTSNSPFDSPFSVDGSIAELRLTSFARVFCANQQMSPTCTEEVVAFAKKTHGEQNIQLYAMIADAQELLRTMRTEKTETWTISPATNMNIKHYTKAILLSPGVKSYLPKHVIHLLFTLCEKRKFDIPEHVFRTPNYRALLYQRISYHFTQSRSTIIKKTKVKASMEKQKTEDIFKTTQGLIGRSGVQLRTKICAFVAIIRGSVASVYPEECDDTNVEGSTSAEGAAKKKKVDKKKDDEEELSVFHLVDKKMQEMRGFYKGDAKGFAEELRAILMADRAVYGDDPSWAKAVDLTNKLNVIDIELDDIIAECTASGQLINDNLMLNGAGAVSTNGISNEDLTVMRDAFNEDVDDDNYGEGSQSMGNNFVGEGEGEGEGEVD